jgi:hypothetical protein
VSGDLSDALATYDALREAFPEPVEPYLNAAIAPTRDHHDAETGVLLESAQERFPTHPGVAAALAGNLRGRGDLTASLTQWRALRERFPAACQVATGEAEALAIEAQRRFPAHPAPAIAFADTAMARGDEASATLRWDKARARGPGCLRSLARVCRVPAAAGSQSGGRRHMGAGGAPLSLVFRPGARRSRAPCAAGGRAVATVPPGGCRPPGMTHPTLRFSPSTCA